MAEAASPVVVTARLLPDLYTESALDILFLASLHESRTSCRRVCISWLQASQPQRCLMCDLHQYAAILLSEGTNAGCRVFSGGLMSAAVKLVDASSGESNEDACFFVVVFFFFYIV